MHKFITDEEIVLQQNTEEAISNDLLNTSTYVDALTESISAVPKDKSFTIGLYGEWGTGKSSIIKSLQAKLEGDAQNEYKFVSYDAWKYNNDSFRRMFLLELQKQLGVQPNDMMKRFYDNINEDIEVKQVINWGWIPFSLLIIAVVFGVALVTGLIGTQKSLEIATVISICTLLNQLRRNAKSDLKVTCQKSRLFAPEQFEECFDEIIQASLTERSKIKRILKWIKAIPIKRYSKIIIVVDNIDRCSAPQAQDLLTTIKSFLGNQSKVIFIVPIAVNSLKHHLVKSSNGETDEREANEYLRKFFNVSIWIKPFQNDEMFDFTEKLNEKYAIGLSKSSIRNISREYATNPRRIIQLLNNLMVDFTLYEEQFVRNHEELICVFAIIREEFSYFYAKLINNPHLLFEDIFNDADLTDRLRLFLDRTKATWYHYEEHVEILDDILSNSSVFNGLQKEILEAIEVADIEKIEAFTAGDEKKKSLIKARLVDDLTKAINRGLFDSEVPMLINTVAKLHGKSFFERADYLPMINLLFNADVNWKKLMSYVLSYSPMQLVSLSKTFFDLSYSKMLGELTNYFELKVESPKSLSVEESNVFCYLCSLIPEKLVNSRLNSCFENAYLVSPANTFKHTYKYASLLYSDKIIDPLVDKIDNTDEEGSALWQLAKINVALDSDKEDVFVKVINKICDLCPKYNYQKNNKTEILGWVDRVCDYLDTVPKLRIGSENLVEKFIEHFSNTVQESQYYNKVIKHNIYLDNKDDKDFFNSLLRLLELSTKHCGRIDVSAETIERLVKSCVSSKTIEMFNDFTQKGIDVFSYAKELMLYTQFDEHFLKLLKYLLKPNQLGEFQISSSLAENKLVAIVDNIISTNDERLSKWLSQVITLTPVQKQVVDILSKKTTEQLLNFPSDVLKLVVSKFEDEIDQYENNQSVLCIIASNGSGKGIRELVKIIIKKFVTKGKEASGLALVSMLRHCSKTDKMKLISQLEDLNTDGISKEDVETAIKCLNEICK